MSDQGAGIKGAIMELQKEGVFTGAHFLDIWHFMRSINIKDRLLSHKLMKLLYIKT